MYHLLHLTTNGFCLKCLQIVIQCLQQIGFLFAVAEKCLLDTSTSTYYQSITAAENRPQLPTACKGSLPCLEQQFLHVHQLGNTNIMNVIFSANIDGFRNLLMFVQVSACFTQFFPFAMTIVCHHKINAKGAFFWLKGFVGNAQKVARASNGEMSLK